MIDDARARIDAASNVVVFSGAGLSAESGVPTFRDAATSGFWTKYDPTRLASPEGFAADPEMVIRWYDDRRRGVHEAQPGAAHRALAARPDIVNVTQNVDDLLERAGATGVLHLHGTIDRDRCHQGCGYEEAIALDDPPGLRSCPRCEGPLRPAVVWFGESLPAAVWSEAEAACARCDVLLVVGTSAEVYPAAGLIDLAKHAGATIIVVNTQPSAASGLADVELIGPAGTVLPSVL